MTASTAFSSSPLPASAHSLLHLLTHLSTITSSLQHHASSCHNPGCLPSSLTTLSNSLLYLHTLLLLPPISPASPRHQRQSQSLGRQPLSRPMTMLSFTTNSSSDTSYGSDVERNELPIHLEKHKELIQQLLLGLEKLLLAAAPRIEGLDGQALAGKVGRMEVGVKAVCEALTGGAGDWVGDWEMERILGRAIGMEIEGTEETEGTRGTRPRSAIQLTITTGDDGMIGDYGQLTPWSPEDGGGLRHSSEAGNRHSYHYPPPTARSPMAGHALERDNRFLWTVGDHRLREESSTASNSTALRAPTMNHQPSHHISSNPQGYMSHSFPYSVPPTEPFTSSPVIFAVPPALLTPTSRVHSFRRITTAPSASNSLLDVPQPTSRANTLPSQPESSPTWIFPSSNSSRSPRAQSSPTDTHHSRSTSTIPPHIPPSTFLERQRPPPPRMLTSARSNGPLDDDWLPPDLSSPPPTEDTGRYSSSLADNTAHIYHARNSRVIPPHESPHHPNPIRPQNRWKHRLSALLPNTTCITASPSSTNSNSSILPSAPVPSWTEIRITLESLSPSSSSPFSKASAKRWKRDLWTGSIPLPLAVGLHSWLSDELRAASGSTILPLRLPSVLAKRIHPVIPHAKIPAWTSALTIPSDAEVDAAAARKLFWALPEDERVLAVYLLSLLRFLICERVRTGAQLAGVFAACFLGEVTGRPGSSGSGMGKRSSEKGKRKEEGNNTDDVVRGFEQLILAAPALLIRSSGTGEKKELKLRTEVERWCGAGVGTRVELDGSEVVNLGRVRHVLGDLGTGKGDGEGGWDWRGEIGGRWQGMGN